MKLFCIHLALPLIFAASAAAQGTAFNYQGHLSDGGNAITGLYDLRFALFDAITNGSPAGTSVTETAVDVRNGLFSTSLDFGPEVFTGSNRWLEISVRTNGGSIFTTLTPRQPLLPTPYAITAANLSGSLGATQLNGVLPSSALAGDYSAILNFNNESNHYAGDGTALKFGGFGYCALPCYWNLNGNAGTAPVQNFVGTTDNTPLEFRVNGQRALRLEPTTNSPNVIGGFEGNSVDGGMPGNTISGGGSVEMLNMILALTTSNPGVSSQYSTISGGAGNGIKGIAFATIGGGNQNSISKHTPGGLDGTDDTPANTIGGGSGNSISEAGGSAILGGTSNSIRGEDLGNRVHNATIGGGLANVISTEEETVSATTIAGGQNNSIAKSSSSSIGGGFGNTVYYSSGVAIAGGGHNTVDEDSSFVAIAGGANNSVGRRCAGATIAGGQYNTITNDTSENRNCMTILGGSGNLVHGSFGTVLGGINNEATKNALAAGTRAKAIHSGAFVWSAGNTNDYPSTADNRVHFYAAGGLAVEYAGQDADGRGLKWLVLASQEPGKVINVYNGAYLSEGGAWTDTSDRNAKEKFEPVDSKEILERVTKMPLSSWSYRSESNSVRHLGPVAQDFHAAFGLGADDKHIAGLDSSGVALAAIQGLSQELKAKQTEIEQLKQRLEALERRLDGSPR